VIAQDQRGYIYLSQLVKELNGADAGIDRKLKTIASMLRFENSPLNDLAVSGKVCFHDL